VTNPPLNSSQSRTLLDSQKLQMKLKPELKPELTQTNGFVEVLILGKEYFVKVSDSNYLQTERSSRWSGWRE